jgi:hypothetical protein
MPEWFSLEDRKSFAERAFTDLQRQIEKAKICIEKCHETIQGVEKAIAEGGWVVEAQYLESVHAISKYSFMLMERVENILNVRRIRAMSYNAENDLGEKVWQVSEKKIEPRWHGESMTASDVFFRYNDKRIMVQDKATSGDCFQVTDDDIKKLLSDSIEYGHYPALCISFEENKEFTHFVIPIEEVMSLIKKKSVTFSKSKLSDGTIRALLTEDFATSILGCSFPSMKHDEKQLKVWLNRLGS